MATRLSYGALNPATSWKKDDLAVACSCCPAQFSLLVRRHHCRACGSLVCDNCSRARLPVGGRHSQRVCDKCATGSSRRTHTIGDGAWEEDDERVGCAVCHTDFTLIVRRHHCRRCGKIICNACSESRRVLNALDPPVRVCDLCVLSDDVSSVNYPPQEGESETSSLPDDLSYLRDIDRSPYGSPRRGGGGGGSSGDGGGGGDGNGSDDSDSDSTRTPSVQSVNSQTSISSHLSNVSNVSGVGAPAPAADDDELHALDPVIEVDTPQPSGPSTPQPTPPPTARSSDADVLAPPASPAQSDGAHADVAARLALGEIEQDRDELLGAEGKAPKQCFGCCALQ